MTSLQLKKKLDHAFQSEHYQTTYNREEDKYRVELKNSHKGVSITLAKVVAKYEQRGQVAIDELVHHVVTSLNLMEKTISLLGNEKKILPVIRSTSFPTKAKSGQPLIWQEHTAETRIYYALDLPDSYQLIDQSMLDQAKISKQQVSEMALFNLRSLTVDLKEDKVAGNSFYFVSANDGYDASRILNESWLETMAKEAKGALALAVPHQDTLIVADIQNDMGYDILAQMAMQFFAEGRVPITALSFFYEDHKLEPVFILAKKKPLNQNEKRDD